MTTGISELMSAETRATHIVAEARNARGERLKVAKQDAQTVINMVRTEKEAAFLSRSNQPLDNDKLLDMKKTTHAEVKTMTFDCRAPFFAILCHDFLSQETF